MIGMSSREGVIVPLKQGPTGSKQHESKTMQMHDTSNLQHCASLTWWLPPKVLNKRSNTTTTLPSIQELATLSNQQAQHQESSNGGRKSHPKLSQLLKINKEPAMMTKIWQQTREHGPTLWHQEIELFYRGMISEYVSTARISLFSASGRPSIFSWLNSRHAIPPFRSTLSRVRTTEHIHQFNSLSKTSHSLT